MVKKKRSTIKKRLWKVISEYIRRKHADDNGYVSCVTCGITKHWKEMQAGHFIPQAQGDACRYIEENIHPQDYRCNINLGGNGPEYNAYMLEMYGQEKIDELRRLSKTTVKLSISDLEELEAEYNALLNNLDDWEL